MLCFRDMSFCGSDCTNRQCTRYFSADDKAAARRWWGSDEAPVAFMDFSADCPDYKGPRQ